MPLSDTIYPEAPAGQNEQLCHRCAELNVEGVLQGTVADPPKPLMARMFTQSERRSWEKSACPLCRFLFTITIASSSGDSADVDGSGFGLKLGLKKCPKGFIPPDDSGNPLVRVRVGRDPPYWRGDAFGLCTTGPTDLVGTVRLIEPERIDFGLLKEWLNTCESSHTSPICNWKQDTPLVNLRLIDCGSRRLVEAPLNCKFTALSYVWGPPTKEKITLSVGDALPSPAPRTIEDAITATSRLGYQYLWIDRYCIQQENNKDFDTQVKQMHLIYIGAEVTLIAAYGDGPEAGLPGVSETWRSFQQYSANIAGSYFATCCSPQQALQAIADSVWNSRAWTFQEAFLARRRIFFTDQQVVFYCSEIECFEALKAPMKHREAYAFLSDVDTGNRRVDVLSLIRLYSCRKLSYDNDIINGFMGVIGRFRSTNYAVWHHWGVPIFPPEPRNVDWFPPDQRNMDWAAFEAENNSPYSFVYSLSWSCVNGRNERRPGFPSWSWTGWKWPVMGFSSDHAGLYRVDLKTVTRINIELENGGLIPLVDFERAQSQAYALPKASLFLHITAWTTTVRIQSNKPYSVERKRAELLAIPEQKYLKGQETLTFEFEENAHIHQPEGKGWEDLQKRRYIGIILGDLDSYQGVISSWPINFQFVMVVENKGDYYERIGSSRFGLPYDGSINEGPPWAWYRLVLEWRTIRVG